MAACTSILEEPTEAAIGTDDLTVYQRRLYGAARRQMPRGVEMSVVCHRAINPRQATDRGEVRAIVFYCMPDGTTTQLDLCGKRAAA